MIVDKEILVMDDDIDVCRGIEQIFGIENEILVANSISVGKSFLSKFELDYVFLDKNFPEGDAEEILLFIKSNGLCPKVILISGDSNNNTILKYLKLGASDYVVKSRRFIEDLIIRTAIIEHRKEKKANSNQFSLPTNSDAITPEHYQSYKNFQMKNYILNGLGLTDGSVRELASRMGIARSTLFKAMNNFGISSRKSHEGRYLDG